MINYVSNSIKFLNRGKCNLSAKNAFAPDGNKDAVLISNTRNFESYFLAKTKVTLANGLYYCKSIFIKPRGTNSNIIFYGVGGNPKKPFENYIIFNAITKQFTTPPKFSNANVFYSYSDEFENGWIRVRVTVLKTNSNFIDPDTYYVGGYQTSDLLNSFWVWGSQFEIVDSLEALPADYNAVGVEDKSTFYNRDSNIYISPTLTSLTFNPVYGSRVQFNSTVNSYETNNSYRNTIPLSINSLRAKFDLKFDLNENEAKQLVNFIENKNGIYPFEFKDPSNIYKPISGYCTDYAINTINKNHYEIAASFEVDQAPNLFNWYNMNFINSLPEKWKTNIEYQKYDILYYDTSDNSTNMLNYSEDFSNNRWRGFGAEVFNEKNIKSPNEKNTVFKLYEIEDEDGEGIPHFLSYSFSKTTFDEYYRTSSLTSFYTLSIFAKAGERNKLALKFSFDRDNEKDDIYYNTVIFNLANGTYDLYDEDIVADITLEDNGFYRCSIKMKKETNILKFNIFTVKNISGKDELIYNGTEGYGLYIWGAQLQPGVLTEYFQTNENAGKNNKLNNFYYCSYDHNSVNGLDTEPTDSITPWRRDFFFEPDLNMQNTTNLQVAKLDFKNSFLQRIKTKNNIASLSLTYKFSNIPTKKAKAILHFLENKGGYRRFLMKMDSVYNKPKVFYSPSWSHVWKSINSHDIEVTLVEDPLGIIPQD